jgi:hypothetical protein
MSRWIQSIGLSKKTFFLMETAYFNPGPGATA